MKYLVIFFVFVGFHVSLFGHGDSISVVKKSTKNDTWFYGSEPNKRFAIDSSIFQIHRYNFVYNSGVEYLNLGNTGTAAYPLVFDNRIKRGFDIGFHQFDLYKYKFDSVKFYQVLRPYAELSYSLGPNKESVFNGKFANSHKKNIYYGVDFLVLNSPGNYTNQQVLTSGFNLYGIYNSKSDKFEIGTDLIFNTVKSRENGGLAGDFMNKDTTFFKRTLMGVKTSTAQNNFDEVDWYLHAKYKVGKKYYQRINDSTRVYKTLPQFTIGYQLNISRERYSYRDSKPDSLYYLGFNSAKDSLVTNQKIYKIGNSFQLNFMAKKLLTDSTFKEQNLLMGAAVNFDYYKINQKQIPISFLNSSVSGYLKSNPALNDRLLYKASVQYFFAGFNRNDFYLDGMVGIDLRKFGMLSADASYSLKEQSRFMQSFATDSFSWNNHFAKANLLKFGGQYSLQKFGITLGAHNFILKNYTYVDETLRPILATKAINIFTLNFSNRFGIRGFHFDNDIWMQLVSGNDLLHLPKLVTKHSLYYERRLFKNNLWFTVGADLRYNSNTLVNGYNPLLGQFYLQQKTKSNFFPTLDLFLNLRIRTVRIFVLGSNLSQLLTPRQKNYYNAALYPARDAAFVIGVKWRFYE